jgi:hypothetical protein
MRPNAIVALVAIAAIAGAGACKRAAQIGKGDARYDAANVRSAAVDWRARHADACPTMAQLVSDKTLVVDPDEHHRETPPHVYTIVSEQDPWGQPYKIVCSVADVRVSSFGPDTKEGTPDDVNVP